MSGTATEEELERLRAAREKLGVPSYGKPYHLEDDPAYRSDRQYGPGFPFASLEHEMSERQKIAREMDTWIERQAAAALKLRRGVNR